MLSFSENSTLMYITIPSQIIAATLRVSHTIELCSWLHDTFHFSILLSVNTLRWTYIMN